MQSDHRLAPALAARVLGLVLVVLAIGVVLVTLLASLLRWPPAVFLVVAALGVLVVVAGGIVVTRVPMVSLDEHGYRVRMVRGAGVKEAAWEDVEDAVTARLRDTDCVVLRLRDGRTTTIPLAAVAGERDAFVADLRGHLRRGEGLRPL